MENKTEVEEVEERTYFHDNVGRIIREVVTRKTTTKNVDHKFESKRKKEE